MITYFYARAIVIPQGESVAKMLLILVGSNYIFKMIAALLDTIPFYLGVGFLVPFLGLDPDREFKSSSSQQL